MVGRPAAPASPGRDRAAASVVARITQRADYAPAGQDISTVMAIAGIMLLLRSVRMTSTFTSSSNIPLEYVNR
ncbi:hypothetical protein MC885_004294 [Smutsia gigantea]|nr:hypothetical protein MC885_004294 [Smutsia gigantea]